MNRTEILVILNELFNVPLDYPGDLDLRDYIKDSIDVGEFVAEVRQRHSLDIHISDFKDITHLEEVVSLLNSKTKHDL